MNIRIGSYFFEPDWKTTLLTVLLFPFLISLGNWQLQRQAEKQDLLTAAKQLAVQAPKALPLSAMDTAELRLFSPVKAVGTFTSSIFLLDNRVQRGKVGYEVVQAFQIDNGGIAWVNRGFIVAGRTRAEMPVVTTPSGPIALRASVYIGQGDVYTLQDTPIDNSRSIPVIQRIELEQLNKAASLDNSFAYELRIEPDSIGALQADWPTVNTDPAKHQGYAVQWFAMSFALIIFYIIRSLRKQEQK